MEKVGLSHGVKGHRSIIPNLLGTVERGKQVGDVGTRDGEIGKRER